MEIKGKKGILKAGYGNKIFLFRLILEQTLKYKNIIKMNLDLMEFIYSRDNLPRKIKDGAYAINLDEYGDVGIHWIVLYNSNIEIIYFESFGVEQNLFDRHKNIKTNIFRIQTNNSIMCGYFCIGFIDFMHVSKTLLDCTSLFLPFHFQKDDNIILNSFKNHTHVKKVKHTSEFQWPSG